MRLWSGEGGEAAAGVLRELLGETESLPPIVDEPLDQGRFVRWFEHLEGSAPVMRKTRAGQPAIMGDGPLRYLAGWPCHDTFSSIIRDLCAEAGIEALDLPEGLRLRDTVEYRFVFNYAPEPVEWDGTRIEPAGVHWQKRI